MFEGGPEGKKTMEKIKTLLSEEVARAIDEMGYVEATPIQAASIPPMLEGKDIIGQAQTGTGKTAAFGIPLIEKLDPAERTVQALVLCPTRELAMQTAGELTKLAKYKSGVSVLPVYGGAPIERQIRMLQLGVQVVVGTPGRVMDHMNRGTLSFEHLRLAVLDEADEMLDMGFREDIETILSATPESRQTALFSATMPRPIYALAQKYLKDPVNVSITPKELTVDKIEQYYISVRSFHKTELLSRLLLLGDIKLALVFVNTKTGVESVVTELQHRGFSAAGLHGDMRQIERDAIMARFRAGLINVLVATDVAARGIDVDDIEAVFNYDIPGDAEYYVHRIGRTGRAGKTGVAYTFVVGRETSRMWDFRRITGAKILCRPAPDAGEVERTLATRVLADVVKQTVEGEEPDAELMERARELLTNVEPTRAAAVMLQQLIAFKGAKVDSSIDLTPPAPVRPPRPAQPAPAPHRPYGQRSYDRRPYGRDGEAPRDRRDFRPHGEYPRDRRDNRDFRDRPPRDNRGGQGYRDHAPRDNRDFHDRPDRPPRDNRDFRRPAGKPYARPVKDKDTFERRPF